jgi:hypothetical protein
MTVKYTTRALDRATTGRFSRLHEALFPAMEFLLGMGLAQAVATLQVHLSNLRLYDKMAAAAAAGFLTVPNPAAMPLLLDWKTAFCGGLLFTLSVGAGISFLSVAAALGWGRTAARRRADIIILVLLWAVVLVWVNHRGVDIMSSLYFLLIPPPVIALTAAAVAGLRERTQLRAVIAARAMPMIILALAWFTQYDHNLFIDLRDHLLLSNPAGEHVSSFYYRYTLYPAEVFKSLDQKQIKTVDFEAAAPGEDASRIKAELAANDWIPVAAGTAADGVVRVADGQLVFESSGDTLFEGAAAGFLANPQAALKAISARVDRWGPFRSLTFFCVLIAFPTALFVLVFALLQTAVLPVLSGSRADWLAAAVCLFLGLGILAWFSVNRQGPPAAEHIEAALASARWQQRIAALRELPERHLDICDVKGYQDMLRSPHPQVRYWLAKALAASSKPAASAILLRLLDDPNLNVRTMALDGIARRGERRAEDEILRRLSASGDWYEQWYAYRTLRRLGWKQTASP